jgi:DNA polymerase I-like protein with 3'-5' exonuclease and polymerase domains
MLEQSLFRMDELHPVKTVWTPPANFPNLLGAKQICIDLETCDPGLKEKGPGTRRESFIAGIAIGTDDGFRGYFPIAHELGGNMDKGIVYRWLKEELGRTSQDKIGANLLYDLEFLACAGIQVKGKCYDIQYAAPLLDENKRSYSLESIAQEQLGEGKVTTALHAWMKQAFGSTEGCNYWRSPVGLVGPYAEGDVDLPLRILEKQKIQLAEQGLLDLFEMECSNMDMLLAMRLRGVRVDVDKAERIRKQLQLKVAEYQKQLNFLAGTQINVDAAASIAKVFDKLGIEYPRTAKTAAPSFVKGWLEGLTHIPEVQLILSIRKFQTIISTFLTGYILDMNVNGRLYGMFHPLRSDEGGTVSGRFSSSLPNLQNIPSRDIVIG